MLGKSKVLSVSAFILGGILSFSAFAVALDTPTPTPTATNTPTSTPTSTLPCTMRATVSAIASPSTVTIGDTVTVSLNINTNGGCYYFITQSSVSQLGTAGVFTPASQTEAGGRSYTFTAASVGTINFTAGVYGEYANDYTSHPGVVWTPRYISGDSSSVTVVTPTPTFTPDPSWTSTPSPTITNTSTPTVTNTSSPTDTPTITNTPILTGTPSPTPTRKPTPTPSTPSFTPTPTSTPVVDTDVDGIPDVFDKYPTDATKQGKDGVQSKGSLGSSVAYLGDVNADGYGDYVAGSPLQDVNGLKDAGRAIVVSGRTGQIIYTFDGDATGDYFGHAVANAGDINGDGVNDIVVGAYGADKNNGDGTSAKDAGTIKVFSGVNGSFIYQKWGSAAKDFFGFSVAGRLKLATASPTPTPVFGITLSPTPSMPPLILTPTPTPVVISMGAFNSSGINFNTGVSITRLGEVSPIINIGIVVGSPLADVDDGNGGLLKDAGKVEIFSGVNGSLISRATGSAEGDKLGWSVANAGDVISHDGYSDVIAGAPIGENKAGYAVVFSPDTSNVIYYHGTNAGDNLGISVSAAGDVNNDGFNDVIVGAYKKDSSGKQDVGSAAIYSGNTSQVLYEFTGDAVKDLLGFSVASAGDINNDGFDDVVVSSYGYDVPATNTSATLKDAGKITVYSGANGNTLFSVSGEGKQDIFGSSVSAGDVNKDGVPDILVGAFKDDVQSINASMKDAGSITIISGAAALP